MFDEIKEKIKDKNLVLFGEMHGTKETPEIISQFFSELAKEEDFNLCMEIPIEFQNQINSFIESGNLEELKNIFFFSDEGCSDGRKNYIEIINAIYKINLEYNRKIQIFCVDPSAKNQNEKEIGLAINIINSIKDKKTFAILGDVHTSKKEVSLGSIKIIPAGLLISERLNEKMVSIRIASREKELTPEEAKFNSGFDYTFNIDRFTPYSFLD